MKHLNHILSELKDHATEPPAHFFMQIFEKSKVDFSSPSVEMLNENERKMCASVRDAKIEPPAFLFKSICATAGLQNKIAPVKHLKTAQNFIFKIAAALILVFGLYLGWKYIIAEDEMTVGSQISKHKTPSKKILPVLDSASDQQPVAKIPKQEKAIKTPFLRSETFILGDYNLQVIDNDYMAAFMNLDYNRLPSFLTTDSEEVPIKMRVDKSSEITVSTGMIKMMKRMYQKKRNGKPTFRAKREMRRLKNWKKSDAKFFDEKLDKNPMDPIELSQLLF